MINETTLSSKAAVDDKLTEGGSSDRDNYSLKERERQKGYQRSTEFYLLPIPKHLQFNPDKPFTFKYSTTIIYAVSTTIITGNLYYCQPLLIQMAKTFNVSYERVSLVPTLTQAGYALGLFLICPLGDFIRRRQVVLALTLITTLLTIGLTATKSANIFCGLSFIIGFLNVAPQILIPLVAETAPEDVRGFAFSIVLTGLMFGIMLSRVVSGLIAEWANWRIVYYVATGLQAVVLAGLYFTMPDYPRKFSGRVQYWKIHWSMVVLAVTKPVAVQVILINLGASACFSYYWVTLTFLLGGAPYHYSTLIIGLFGLIGLVGVAAGPLSGRVVDKIRPWHSLLLCTTFLLVFQAVQVVGGGIHVSAVIISGVGQDFFQQIQCVALATYIFSVSKAAISRLNALYMVSFYIGQIIGSSAGTTIFFRYGWRAAAFFSFALYAAQLGLLVARGPNCSAGAWVGYEGGVSIPRRFDDGEDTL
ncbi:MFS DHA1 transporter [Agrocybe pediades]|nr:MFS DHA1 transporter [Agrocybe pediades]